MAFSFVHSLLFDMNLDPIIEQYIAQHSSFEGNLLQELERETHQKTTQPNMISGFVQGRVLSMIAKMLQPKNILEIGTFTGYATLCLAEGLAENGKIITIDCNDELRYLPEKYFANSPYASQIQYIHGNAIDILPNLSQVFDLIFIDADKQNYLNYWQLLQNKLKVGSVILADNVLWYGKVADENHNDRKTSALKNFNKKITESQEFENIILPIRDGINIIRKVK